MSVTVAAATGADIADLADLAARTFPLACPPDLPATAITAFVEQELSADALAAHLADPDADLLIARDPDLRAVGYALSLHRPAPAGIARLIGTGDPVTYLSKLYVRAGTHGGGTGRALFERLRERARERGSRLVWLGTNQQNVQAQRFYTRVGFERAGTRTFEVGGLPQEDFIYVLREPAARSAG